MYLLFSILFILLGVGKMKTSFVGFLPKGELSLSKHFTKFSSPMLTTLSLGKASGGLRLLWEWLSSCGQHIRKKSNYG